MRFGIHGSCVTRDMFSFLNLDEHLHAYQARSSLATKGPELIDHDGKRVDGEGGWLQRIPSAFQRRMVEWDLSRAPYPFGEIDVLIIDLIDERFNSLMAGERLVTMSKALNDAGGVEELNATRAHGFGSEAHFKAFEMGLAYFGGTIPRNDVRVVFHDARWAKRFLADDGLNDFENQARIELNNRNLSRMSEMVVEMIQPDLRIRIPDEDIISDPGHRWGKASVHYTLEYYESVWRVLSDWLIET